MSVRQRWVGPVLAACAAWPALVAGPAWAADAKEIASTVCLACHGEGGNSVVPMFPRLAGLQAEYLAKQLNDFLDGKRKNEMMAPSLTSISAGDVRGLAAYFAGQKPAKGTTGDPKLAEKGKALYDDGNVDSGVPACVGCHQPEGAGNERYPRLAGQHATYTAAQMSAFKAGTRTNDRAKVMRAVAERLTEQEIAALSEYLAGM